MAAHDHILYLHYIAEVRCMEVGIVFCHLLGAVSGKSLSLGIGDVPGSQGSVKEMAP